MNEPKQVIIIRKDLKMRKGKIASQAAHASMKIFFDNIIYSDHGILEIDNITPEMYRWINGSFVKIVVGVNSESELIDILTQSHRAGLPTSLIQDDGRTEFNGIKTHTAGAIGPADSDKIDKITGQLSLL